MDSKRQFTVMQMQMVIRPCRGEQNSDYNWTGPGSSVARVSLWGTGGHGFDPGPRHSR